MSYDDQDYHRRRSEIELDKAVSAAAPESAAAHLELARMHRARRLASIKQRSRRGAGVGIFKTDKEA